MEPKHTYDYFYNEKGDYTITKNSAALSFTNGELAAKIIVNELNDTTKISAELLEALETIYNWARNGSIQNLIVFEQASRAINKAKGE